ncbi:MAG TPA: endonuclease/exonuclease/phosphatase family protein, partial [Pirellulales bacterium]
MPRSNFVHLCWLASLISIGVVAPALAQSTATLRIATYNIEADIEDTSRGDITTRTTPRSGLYQVLEAIGTEKSSTGNFQPFDILALQETTSNSTTVAPIVNALNSYYDGYFGVASGAPAVQQPYAQSPVQGGQNGVKDSGNGPNAVVYNQKTLTLIASVGVGTPHGSSNGEYRQVMRYEFRPVGGTAANDFYVYVSHYKASTGSTNEAARNGEAQIIRNDEAANLPSDARVLYVGDFNVGSSDEAMYQTLVAPNSPSGINQGQAFDVLNPSGATGISWETTPGSNLATKVQYRTENSTDLHYRDDFEMMTSNVYNGIAGGLSLI